MHRHEIYEYLNRAISDLGAVVLTANEATAAERQELDAIRVRLRTLAHRFHMLTVKDIRGSTWQAPTPDVEWS